MYLFNLDARGQVKLLRSNRLQAGGNLVKANTTRVFPAKGVPSTFVLTLPEGLNKVLAVASRTPLDLAQIAQFKAQRGGQTPVSVQGQAGLAQALSIVVRPNPPESWMSDTAQYSIVHPRVAQLPALDAKARRAQVSFRSTARLSEVYVAYTDRLRAASFAQRSASYGEQRIKGVFGRKDGQPAEVRLYVGKKGKRFEVTLTRC